MSHPDFHDGELPVAPSAINGRFYRDCGNDVLERSLADAVTFGKPFISNPDLVERIRRGVEWARWDENTFYTPGPKGYTDYPHLEG